MVVKRLSLVGVLVVGLVLVVFPFATNLFSKTGGVEQLTGDFRSSFTPEALQQTRTDMDGIVAMSKELQDKTLPALPAALQMTPDQFSTFMATTYPDVATGIGQLNTIVPRFDGLVAGLEAEAPDFRRSDSIPTSFLPSTVVPFLFLVPGLLLVGLAGFALVRTRSAEPGRPRAVALGASAVVGVVLVGATLGLSVRGKATAVDNLTAAFGPVFSAKGAAQARADMDTVQAMSDQLQKETLPGLAKALTMDDAQFASFMADNYPDVAAGVGQLDTVLPRFQQMVAGIQGNVDAFHKAATIPTAATDTTALFWWLVVPGVALILVPAASLGGARVVRRSAATVS